MSESGSAVTARRKDGSAGSVAASGTIRLLAARGFLMVSAFLSTVIAARGLGPTEYGVYGIVMSVLAWVEIVASAGIPGAISRLLPLYAQEASAFARVAMGCLLMVSLICFCGGWLLAPDLAQLFQISAGALVFRIAFLDIPFNGLYVAYQGIFNGYRRFTTTSVGLIVYSAIKLGGIIILFVVLGLSVSGLLLVNVLATISALIYFGFIMPPGRAPLDYAMVRPIVQVALPFSLILAFRQVLVNLDLWSLKSLGTEAEIVGIYVAAGNIPRMLQVVPDTVGDVLLASLAWAFVQKNQELARRYIQATMRFIFVVLLPCCVLLVQDAEAVMTLIYSNTYAAGEEYLRLQIIAVMPQAFFGASLVTLAAAEKYATTVGMLFCLVVLAVVLNLGLIPPFGAMGAAAAAVLTNTIGASAGAMCLYREFGSMIRLSTVGRGAVAAALIALVSEQLPVVGAGVVLKIGLLMAGYVLLLILFRELHRGDLRGFALRQ